MEERKHTTAENVSDQALWPLEIDFNPARQQDMPEFGSANRDLECFDAEAVDIDSRFGRPQASELAGQVSDFN